MKFTTEKGIEITVTEIMVNVVKDNTRIFMRIDSINTIELKDEKLTVVNEDMVVSLEETTRTLKFIYDTLIKYINM